MKDPKPLPDCVLIMDKMLETLKSIYTEAGRGRNACKLACLINLFTVFSLLSLFRETSFFFKVISFQKSINDHDICSAYVISNF